jgi:hypothetical protein
MAVGAMVGAALGFLACMALYDLGMISGQTFGIEYWFGGGCIGAIMGFLLQAYLHRMDQDK